MWLRITLLILLMSVNFLYLSLNSSPTSKAYHRGSGERGGQLGSYRHDGSGLVAASPGAAISYPDYRGIKMVILSKTGDPHEAAVNRATVNLALTADRMGYARGLTTLNLAPAGRWFFAASYLTVTDTVIVSDDFATFPQADQVRILVHEFAHHGAFNQARDTFEDFAKQGLGEFLPKLIPDAGLQHYTHGEYAQEAFAYSYAHYMLGYPSPVPEIQAFWEGIDAAAKATGAGVDAGVAAVGGG